MALPISYNARNVRTRWRVSLLAVTGIALVVAVFVVLLAMSAGFAYSLRATGDPRNAMIVQRGSGSELTSGVPIDERRKYDVAPRVRGGQERASAGCHAQ